MDIQWVAQEEPMGCGIACLAMLTGQTYAQVAKDFTVPTWKGLVHTVLDEYLAERGFAVARKYQHKHWREIRNKRRAWPYSFGEVHLCLVRVQAGGHYVLMFRDLSVYDPDVRPPWPALGINNERYLQVDSIAAVTPFEVLR